MSASIEHLHFLDARIHKLPVEERGVQAPFASTPLRFENVGAGWAIPTHQRFARRNGRKPALRKAPPIGGRVAGLTCRKSLAQGAMNKYAFCRMKPQGCDRAFSQEQQFIVSKHFHL